jgi:hypothetical protein
VWQLPYKFSSGWANKVFGDWQISQNFFWRSGLPYTIMDGFTTINNYGPTNIPAQINGPVEGRSCVNGNSQCAVPAILPNGSLNPLYGSPGFSDPNNNFISTGLPGFPTQRRNNYRGPRFFDSDFTVGKNFKMTEKAVFNFTTNFYNVFNHPNFTNPDLNLANGTFGTILTTTAPPTGPYGSFFTGLPSGRIIQFAGKITF